MNKKLDETFKNIRMLDKCINKEEGYCKKINYKISGNREISYHCEKCKYLEPKEGGKNGS